jgi:hypothetical protein
MISDMNTNRRIQTIAKTIEGIKTALRTLGSLRPGSLSRQYHVCRKAGCRCQDPDKPRRHGPYYHLDYVHHGKKTTRFIRPAQLAQVRCHLANYKQLRRLMDQWITLALEQAELLRLSPPDPKLPSSSPVRGLKHLAK